MPINDATRATVLHALITGKKVPEALSILDNTCAAGQQCTAVQGSPLVKPTFDALVSAVKTAHTSLSSKQAFYQSLLGAIKTLTIDFEAVRVALRAYELGVDGLANGDGSVINKAGLLSRTKKTMPSALDKVSIVRTKVGKHVGEAILSWPIGPGATGYAIEVNFTPANPAGPWVSLMPGTGRRRVVKAPVAASQFLARVASLGSDGTQSAWSDIVLATTL